MLSKIKPTDKGIKNREQLGCEDIDGQLSQVQLQQTSNNVRLNIFCIQVNFGSCREWFNSL